MSDLRWPVAGLMAAGILGFAAGCGGRPSVDSSHTEVTVKGVVKVDGTPVKGGEITFDPANYQRKDVVSRTAKIGDDGSYTIETLTGENIVTLGGPITRKNPILQRRMLTYDVQSGENTYDPDFGSPDD